jgi:SAM-dependent methyltransferase/dienelactone hydrolase
MRIVGFHDFPKGNGKNREWVIVLPGFYTDHVGESDGDILLTNLTKVKDDIHSSIDYIHRRFQPTAIGAVGSSLASRALVRAAREDHRLGLLVNLVGIVDLRKTLHSIYQEDHFERLRKGLINGIMDVLGFQVNADDFLQSALQDGYENLLTTIDDLRHIKIPLVFFAAEKDLWVNLADVRQAFHAVGSDQKDLYILKGAMHRFYENPRVAKETLKVMVEKSVRYLQNHGPSFAVHEPYLKEIGARLRKERERSRVLHGVTKEEEREFWKSYLEKYSFAINVHDYWNLLDFIYRLLGEPAPGEKVLDAGCGHGNYGTFLILKLAYQLRQNLIVPSGFPFFSYVGVDFIREAILEAKDTQDRIGAESIHGPGLLQKGCPASFSYFLGDLESRLPFRDHAFDKVCCNLVVSYLQDPKSAVADMVRVLKPKGRLVLTSLKPFADLSEVYRNYVQVAETGEQIEKARNLLNNVGRIKAKETEGIYSFFSEEELIDLLQGTGVRDVETYRSFANQANVLVATKAHNSRG